METIKNNEKKCCEPTTSSTELACCNKNQDKENQEKSCGCNCCPECCECSCC